jgi:hypothetical protein
MLNVPPQEAEARLRSVLSSGTLLDDAGFSGKSFSGWVLDGRFYLRRIAPDFLKTTPRLITGDIVPTPHGSRLNALIEPGDGAFVSLVALAAGCTVGVVYPLITLIGGSTPSSVALILAGTCLPLALLFRAVERHEIKAAAKVLRFALSGSLAGAQDGAA